MIFSFLHYLHLHLHPNLHLHLRQHRFLALCLPNESAATTVAYLVFSCPESAPVRKKMIMSSAKVSVIDSTPALVQTIFSEVRCETNINLI